MCSSQADGTQYSCTGDFVQKLASLDEERKNATQRMASLETQNKGLSSNVTQKIDEVRVPLQKQVDALTTDLASARAEADNVQQQLRAVISVRSDTEAKLAELDKQVKEKQMQLKEKDLALSLSSLKAETLAKDADMARQDKDAAQQDFLQIKEKLNGEMLLLKNEKTALEARYAEVSAQLSSAQETLSALRQKKEAKAQGLKEVKDELQGAMDIIK